MVLKDIESIEFEIGGFMCGFEKYIITFNPIGTALFSFVPSLCDEPNPLSKSLSKKETTSFLKSLNEIGVGDWKRSYDNRCIMDGTQWSIVIQIAGKKPIKKSGSNAYPDKWDAFCRLFGIGCDAIKCFTIILNSTKKDFDCETGRLKAFRIREYISVNCDNRIVVYNANDLAGKFVKQEYCGVNRETIDELATHIADSLEFEGWVESKPFRDTTGICFYQLDVERYDGVKVRHKGIYNRANMPDEWEGFIESVKNVFDSSIAHNLISVQDFINAGKPGELKYCSVAISGEKTYYYLTDDDTLSIGDRVIVPFGSDNSEKSGIIKEIEYYLPERVPFPVEKTKTIIKKQ